jgi:hypothetical protein
MGNVFSASFAFRYEKYTFKKLLDEVGLDMSSGVYALVTEGLQLISKWTTQVPRVVTTVIAFL